MTTVLQREQIIPLPRSEVFGFFSRAENLQRLTPDFLHFRILTPTPIEMRAGTRIDYRIRLFGVPLRWRTLIEAWEPQSRFVDVQLRGPYKLWRHTHEFLEAPGGTLMRDTVEYAVPFGALGRLLQPLLVDHTVERIFDFRRQAIEQSLL